MLTNITNVLVISVWALLGAGIVAFALYITIYPLVKTIGGGVLVFKTSRALRPQTERQGLMIPDARLGYTMADGGEPVNDTADTEPHKE